MAAMVVVSNLAKQKKALQRCAPKKETVLTSWTFTAGKTKDIKVTKASSAKTKSCVHKALVKVKAGKLLGQCTAGIVIGR